MSYVMFPCKECTKRRVGCHATCDDYNNAKKRNSKARAVYEKRQRKDFKHYERTIYQ